MEESKMNWIIPAGIVIVILVVSGLAFVNIRGSQDDDKEDSSQEQTANNDSTANNNDQTDDETDPEEDPTATPEPTSSPTPTVTPPATDDTPTVDQEVNRNWVSSVTVQTVSSDQYAIDGQDLKKNGTTIYTSENGDIKSFYVTNTFVLINEGKVSGGEVSRIVKFTPSNNKKALIFRFESVRMEINSFLFNTADDKQYYFTLFDTTGTLQPYVVYEKDYAMVWSRAYTGAKKGDRLRLHAMTANDSALLLRLQSGNNEEVVEYTL